MSTDDEDDENQCDESSYESAKDCDMEFVLAREDEITPNIPYPKSKFPGMTSR